MSSRFALVIALALAACSPDAAELVELTGRALDDIVLASPTDPSASVHGDGTYRWVVIEAPDGSGAQPTGEATATFQPDLRGTYLIERWFAYGVSEDLTHRFVVRVSGVRPLAVAVGRPNTLAVGATAMLDGTASSSPEKRPLTYRWRLTSRPLGSETTIDPGVAETPLLADVAGEYMAELSVFDGELWNDNTATLLLVAQ